jgi:acyl-CoA thioesterase-1
MSPTTRLLSILGVACAGLVAVASLAIAGGALRPTSGQAPARPLTYVAIGASDSVGIGADAPEVEGWVPLLHRHLPPDSRLVNLGISGSLLRQALDQQLPVAVASDPDLVTVWLAVNDLNARVPLQRYRQELDTLLGTLRRDTRAAILIGNIPDVSRVPIYQQLERDAVRREVENWNRVIAEIAAKHGAVLVDLDAQWRGLGEHPEYVSRDGFHPSTAGYRRLADVFFDALAQQTDIT